jgi:hypothetical protein
VVAVKQDQVAQLAKVVVVDPAAIRVVQEQAKVAQVVLVLVVQFLVLVVLVVLAAVCLATTAKGRINRAEVVNLEDQELVDQDQEQADQDLEAQLLLKGSRLQGTTERKEAIIRMAFFMCAMHAIVPKGASPEQTS